MGMFDSVWVTCPQCGTKVEFQSKAGRCHCDKHTYHSVPVEIAVAIDGDQEECNCGYVITLKFPKTTPLHTHMEVW